VFHSTHNRLLNVEGVKFIDDTVQHCSMKSTRNLLGVSYMSEALKEYIVSSYCTNDTDRSAHVSRARLCTCVIISRMNCRLCGYIICDYSRFGARHLVERQLVEWTSRRNIILEVQQVVRRGFPYSDISSKINIYMYKTAQFHVVYYVY